jgi:hypothetical protein
MTSIKKELSKEELIKADTQELTAKVKEVEKKRTNKKEEDPKKALEALGKMFGSMSEGANKSDAKDMQKAGAFLEALGGLMGAEQTKEQKEAREKANIEQEKSNKKADKEFDEMSQELDMFSK